MLECLQNYAPDKDADFLTYAHHFIGNAFLDCSHVPFYATMQDEDSEETGEDVTRDDRWNYADILWNDVRADAVQTAFDKLSYKEQTMIQKRNAVCMTCGRVGSWEERPTFEDLAVMFEGSTASGAERAYKNALDKLTGLLADAGVLGAVELKLIAAAGFYIPLTPPLAPKSVCQAWDSPFPASAVAKGITH